MKMEVKTIKYDGASPSSFNITCTHEVVGKCAKEIFAIHVSRNGRKPLATLNSKNEISYNRLLRSNVEAKGHIGDAGTNSWMNVIFTNVLKEDSGEYACTAIYSDEWGTPHQHIATKNISVEHYDVQDVVRHLMGKLSSMESTIDSLQTQLETQHQELQRAQEMDVSRLEDISSAVDVLVKTDRDQTQRIQSLIDKDSSPCAFTAGYNTKDRVVVGKTVVFSVPILNIGNAFNTATGIFTAPKTGLYLFHLSFRTAGNKWYLHAHLKANDRTLASVDAGSSFEYNQASVSCVAQLQRGDQVRPVASELQGWHLYSPGRHSIFSGYLLYTM